MIFPFMFSCRRNAQVTFVEESQLKIISFQKDKQWYIIHTWTDKGFKGTVVNQTLSSFHEGPLEIRLTVTLKKRKVVSET